MKRTSYRDFWLSLLNVYHLLLAAHWVLRGLFGGVFWWLALLNTFALFIALPLILTLPVALFLRGKRTAALAVILSTIALIKFIPEPKASPSTSENTLRIISYNIWQRNQNLDADIDWLIEQNPDVMVLVEAVTHHTGKLARLVQRYPYAQRIEGNIMLVSRYPILEQNRVVIERASHERDGRLALRAVLDVDGQSLTVYAVHLSVPRRRGYHFPFPLRVYAIHTAQQYDESRRNAQIEQLLNHVKAETNPVILAGDFNMSHTSVIYNDFVDAGLVDTYEVAGSGFGMSWPVVRRYQVPPVLRIDYIWHSDDLQTVTFQTGERRNSDHMPLIADIALD